MISDVAARHTDVQALHIYTTENTLIKINFVKVPLLRVNNYPLILTTKLRTPIALSWICPCCAQETLLNLTYKEK